MKIVLIDDDQELRMDFEEYFTSKIVDEIECVQVTDSIENLSIDLKFDVVLLDIGIYGQSSLPNIVKLRKSFPNTQVVIYSVYEDTEHLLQAFIMGATGYLSKKVPINKIAYYLKNISEGGAAISSDMAKKMISYFNTNNLGHYNLNEREEQVLKMLAEGWSYNKIAASLYISTDGLRYYIKSIYSKLNVNNKTEAIKKYLSN